MKRLTVALSTLALLCAVAPAARAGVQYRGIGAVALRSYTTPAGIDFALDAAKTVGSNTVRIEVPWSGLQPAARGQNDPAFLSLADYTINGAAARGIKVLLTVDSSPCWASAAPPSIRSGCGPQEDAARTSSYPPANPADFASLVSFLVDRYQDKLLAFEDWNEPDQANQLYFAGPRKPQRYAAMVRAAYPAAKHADPRVQVLAGSMVGSNGNWLRALYAQHIKGYYDGITVHYYDLVLASLRAIRVVQKQNHDSKPLWLAEFGWDSCFPGLEIQVGQRCVTRAAQAANLNDIVPELNRASYLRSALLYTLADDSQYDFGLFDINEQPKPSFAALKSALTAAGAPVRPVTLALRRSGGSVTATGSVPAGDLAEILVYHGSQLRYRATVRPDRDEHFSIRLPGVVAGRGNRVIARQPWTGKSARATI